MKPTLLTELAALAETEATNHVTYDYDGETCFNLHTFLESLAGLLETKFSDKDSPNGWLRLDGYYIALLLWTDLALRCGDTADGNTFKGMPILD